MKATPKLNRHIRRTKNGWNGYLGRRKVGEFPNWAAAKEWQKGFIPLRA